MTRSATILLLCLLMSGIVTFAQTSSETDRVKETMIREFRNFSPVAAQFRLNLRDLLFSSEGLSHTPNNSGDIVINPGQIAKYTNGRSSMFCRLFCQFVICHELGHKLQNNGYREAVMSGRRPGGTMFLECQADILAGFFINHYYNTREVPELLAENPGGIEAMDNERTETIFTVLSRIEDMDRDGLQSLTHPANEDRVTALRQGLYLATANLGAFLQTISEPDNVQLTRFIDEKRAIISSISKGLGFDPSDPNTNNAFFWTHSEALRIIHENSRYSDKLIMYDQHIDWNTSSADPVVKFSFKLYNGGEEAISFHGRAVTQIVLRDDPENIQKVAAVDGLEFNKTIPAHQSAIFTGTLTWLADQEYMPRLVLPGDDRSFYWAFGEHPDARAEKIMELKREFRRWNEETANISIDIVHFLSNRRSELMLSARSMGVSSEETQTDVANGIAFYKTLLNVGVPNSSRLSYDHRDGVAHFRFVAFRSTNLTEARSKFDLLGGLIAREFPSYEAQPVDERERSAGARFIDGENILRVDLRRSGGIYEVMIALSAKAAL